MTATAPWTSPASTASSSRRCVDQATEPGSTESRRPGSEQLERAAALPQVLHQPEQDGVAAGAVEHREQLLVVVEGLADPARGHGRDHAVVRGPHRAEVGGGHRRDAEARGFDLEQQPGGVHVRELGGGQVRDDGPAVRDPDDQAVLLEPADRLADGHRAGAELRGQVPQP